jgi:hypothetical protein
MYEKMFQAIDQLVVLSEQQRQDLKRVTTCLTDKSGKE